MIQFSVITPTHLRNHRLLEIYECLQSQTHPNWEWVLYVNGGGRAEDLPQEFRQDRRVKILVAEPGPRQNVGEIKLRAFSAGSGDVLVEVDHDDWITDDCLAELAKAYADPEVGFVYSDAAMYHRDLSRVLPFNASNNWQWRPFTWRGQELVAMRTFPATSHSVCQIWYAPDHVRSWRRSVYHQLGGHNPNFPVCDDHELVIRTYLHTKMVHIPKVLYIYHYHDSNTHQLHPTGPLTNKLFEQYAWDLAVKDAKDQNLLVVDIGGGLNPRPGCVTLDLEDADIVCDLAQGIPLEDNSVGVLNASHILEHLPNPLSSMREIYRVLADGGWAFIEVPSTDGRGAWQDPTHISYWNENSFLYYTNSQFSKYLRIDPMFDCFKLDTVWQDRQVAVTRAWLTALKDRSAYRPGTRI
jgi:O-antigen biosynthesis protein